MSSIYTSGSPFRVLFSLACVVVIVAGLKAASSLLVPFLLAMFVAITCAPLLSWLRKHKVPTALAVLCIICLIALFALLVVVFLGASITDFSSRLPEYQKQLSGKISEYLLWVDDLGAEIPSTTVSDIFNPGLVMSLIGNTLARLRVVLTNTVFILLTVIFILFEITSFPRKIAVAFDDSERSLDQLERIGANINRYLAIKSVTSGLTGVLVGVFVWIMGLDFPLLWGVLAFLLNYIPTIGSFIAAIPALLLALVQLDGAGFLMVCLGYVLINFGVSNGLEPRLFGKGIGLSTLVVFVSLVFWGWVLGPIGMLLSVPLTMIVKIAMEDNPQTRWISIFLGPDPKTKNKEEGNA